MGDWATIAIENLADKEIGRLSFVDGDWIESEHIVNEGIRIIQTGNIGIGKYLDKSSNKKFISDRSFNQLKCKKVLPEDMLICRLADPIGRACIVPNNEEFYVTAVDVIIFRPSGLYSKEFLLYCFNDERTLKLVNDKSGGSTRQRISRTTYGKLELKIPVSKKEQSTIATILTTIDQAIEKTEQLIAKYERIKTGLMQDLLTLGIDGQGNIRSEETHEFKDSPLGRIPKEWEVTELSAITEKIADRDHSTPKYLEEGIIMISPTHFYNTEDIDFATAPRISLKSHEKNKQKTDLKDGDIILHRIGAGLGRVRIYKKSYPECSILHSLALVRANEKVNPLFLKWAFRDIKILNQMGIGTQSIGVPDLGLEKIGSLLFKRPKNISEQKLVAEKIELVQENLNSLLIELAKQNKLKNALMQDLLTGKVRVDALMNQIQETI